ncbi:MAG: hypothetical protein SNG69_08740 [Rikenellaceae bacterium]
MERLHIYIIISVAFAIYIIALFISIKGSYYVDDHFEYCNEDGDHIYYDRKLIQHKNKIKE